MIPQSISASIVGNISLRHKRSISAKLLGGRSNLQTPKIVKPKMKKKDIEIPETTDFSPKAFKKLQRELALARAEIAYLKELEALDRQKQRQKKEKLLKD